MFFSLRSFFFLSPPHSFRNLQSVEHFDLRGVLQNNLQTILRMILDLSMNLDLSAFKTLGGCLVLFEQFRGRSEYDGGQSLARGPEIQEVGVALCRIPHSKKAAANPP